MRQDRQDRQRAVLDHQFEGTAEQEIADQHRRLIAPDGIGAGQTPAQGAVVDHVVMQQGGRVDEFHAGGQTDVTLAAVAAQFGGGQGQHRAQALAAGGDDMSGQLRDQRDRAVHAFDDVAVDQRQIVVDQSRQSVERRPLLAPFVVQVYDDRHGRSPQSILLSAITLVTAGRA